MEGTEKVFTALDMCEAKDFSTSECDELMGLVPQLQEQVAQLTAANEELHKQVAELKRAGKRFRRLRSPRVSEAADPSAPAASRVWGRSATESRRLPMKSPSRW